MRNLGDWLKRFIPEPLTVNLRERLRASLGALLGISITGISTYYCLGASSVLPVLIAPMGASAVLLFALPFSPLAQPWALIGGNILSAIIGVTCAMYVPNLVMAAALAVSLSIGVMIALRCLHPPSGAVALTAVLGGPVIHAQGYHFALVPVALNSAILLLVAIFYNNLTKRPYPHLSKHKPADSSDQPKSAADIHLGFTVEDLNKVLKNYNQVLDISVEDMQDIFYQTELNAYSRRYGKISCADIMSTEVVSVEFGTSLEEAWTLLRKNDFKALPVIDRARRVIGIVTQIDFMKEADLDLYEGFDEKLLRFIKRIHKSHSEKPEVVGQIMTSHVITVPAEMHIIGLMSLMSQHSLHHIPVVNTERKLVGIITQTDLVSALYHRRLDNDKATNQTSELA